MRRLFIALPLSACASVPAPARPIAPEMSELAFYVGHWQCRATAFADGAEPTSYDLAIDVTPRLDGSWFEVVVTRDGKPVTAELKGFSKRDGKYHHVWAVEQGTWGSLVSLGWSGSKMYFEDEFVPAPAVGEEPDPPLRAVFEKLGATRYTHSNLEKRGDAWKTTFTKTCHKG
jgi:hypothetical protein